MARAAAKSTAPKKPDPKKPAAKKPAAPKAKAAQAEPAAPVHAADIAAAISAAIEAGTSCATCPFWQARKKGTIAGSLCVRFPQKVIKGAEEVCGEHPELKFPAGTAGASSGTEA